MKRTVRSAQMQGALDASETTSPVSGMEPMGEGPIGEAANGGRRSAGFFARMSTVDLVKYAQAVIKRTGITGKHELRMKDPSLYKALCQRRKEDPDIMAKVGFTRSCRKYKYESMDTEELIRCAQDVLRDTENRTVGEFNQIAHGLYLALTRREKRNPGTIKRVGFKESGRENWKPYSTDELVARAQAIVGKKGCTRSEFIDAHSGLYEALLLRTEETPDVMTRIEFLEVRRPARDWNAMTDPELIDHAKTFLKEHKITSRFELQNADGGLYEVLRIRKLLAVVFSGIEVEKKKPRAPGFFTNMTDVQLAQYALDIINREAINGREALRKADQGLYHVLWRRHLLDRVFSTIEEAQRLEGIAAVCTALEEFGGVE